jgi:adenylate cyclase
MSTLQSGKTLLHYRILNKIGQGGMGEVYRVEDLKLGRIVAIKVLPVKTNNDHAAKDRFLREARSASALNHPNIVTIYSIEEVDSQDFIVMEYVEGESLKQMIQHSPLKLPDLIHIGMQLGDALAAAHSIGLIHRDIKAANILVTPRYQAKILDFGLAKTIPTLTAENYAEAETISPLTKTGTIVGTLAYMSPEQTRGEALDGRSDIFSLGVVLYEAATGRLPFHGKSLLAVMHEIATLPPTPPSIHNPGLPLQFDLILERALAKDPKYRYPDALEFAQDLKSLLDVETREISIPSEDETLISGSGPEPFVGRESELHQLMEFLQQAMRGSGNSVLLVGEPGIGKTALTEEFFRRVHERHASLMLARGYCMEQYGTGEAYRPFLDAIGSLILSPFRERILDLLRTHAPIFSQQFPAAFASSAALERFRQETVGASRERMLREMVDLLQAMSAAYPLVLLLEDLHWADPSSVDLLRRLSQHITGKRVLIVGTLRPENLELGNHPMKVCKLEMQTHKLCHEIELGFLTLGQIHRYLETRFKPNQFPAELPEMIYKRTEGHPLFAMNLVQFLVERGDIVQVDKHWTLNPQVKEMAPEVPQSVRNMISQKIGTLREGDQRALQFASIQGEEFLSTVLAKMLEVDEIELEERLHALDRVHRLIHALGEEELPDGETTTRYRFVHALYQNLFYEELVSKRRALLHRMAGETLLSHYKLKASRISMQLAMHFERAREYQQAVPYLIQAANNATRLYAIAEAQNHYQHALELIEKFPSEEQAVASFNTTKQMAQIFLNSGSYQEALELFEKCLSYQNVNLNRAEIFLGEGQVYQEKGETEKAIQHLESSLKLMGKRIPADHTSLFLAVIYQAAVQIFHSFFPSFIRKIPDQKISIRERQLFMLFLLIRIYYFTNANKAAWAGLVAINLAERLRSEVDLSIACGYYGAILMGTGMLKSSAAYCKKSLQLARKSNEPLAEALALSRSGTYFLFQNELGQATMLEHHSVKIFKELGHIWELQTSLMLEATAHFLASEFQIAEELFTEMGKIARSRNAILHQGWAFAWAPFCRYLTGKENSEKVKAELLKGLQFSVQVDDLANQCVAYMHLTCIAVREEEPTNAAEYSVQTFERIMRYKVSVPFVQVSLIHAAEGALYALEQSDNSVPKSELIRIVETSVIKTTRLGKKYPYLRGPAMRIQARHTKFLYGDKKAEPIYARCLEALEATPNKWETGVAYYDAAFSSPESNKKYLARARKIFQEIKAAAELQRMNKILAPN